MSTLAGSRLHLIRRGWRHRAQSGAAAFGRRALWRLILAGTGGIRVEGRLPDRPCVLVANHSSHADSVALMAALPARRRPAVAAAADYWFDGAGRWRTFVGKRLTGAFPVRRGGGGSADLAGAAELLHAGRDVIVFPEGTRTRDGSVGHFHSGAARLAARAGAPLVPIGIRGTGALMPVHGRPARATVTLRIGAPTHDIAEARTAVVALTAPDQPWPPEPDSRLRCAVARFAASRTALLVFALWAFAEALVWPLLPEFAIAIVVVAAPRRGLKLAAAATIGSIAGGIVMYALSAHGITVPAPLTTPRMYATVVSQYAAQGAWALHHQPLSGIPFKVYGAGAGRAHVGLLDFVAIAIPVRGLRLLAVAKLSIGVGVAAKRWRRWYPAYLATFIVVFSVSLAGTVHAWT